VGEDYVVVGWGVSGEGGEVGGWVGGVEGDEGAVGRVLG